MTFAKDGYLKIPPGLQLPDPDAHRDALPSDAPPADYPARLPFVVNQAVSYAASEDLAICTWPALPAGEHPTAQATSRPRGMFSAVTRMQEALGALAAMKTPDPAAKAILDDVFDRVLAAAAASGWAGNEAAPSSFPPGLRQVTLARPGERMEVMAFPSPPRFVVIAMSFDEASG